MAHTPLPVQTALNTGTQLEPQAPFEGGPQARKPKSHWQQSLGPSVGVEVGEIVGDDVDVRVAVAVGVRVGVRVNVNVGVNVAVGVRVGVVVEVGVGVGVRVTQLPLLESQAALNTGTHCGWAQLSGFPGPQARNPKLH